MSLPILSRPLCAGAALTWLLTACTGPPETDGTAMPAPERPLDLAADVRARAAEAGLTALPVAPEVREELFVLGRALAFDKILSGPQNISCMTCHHPLLATGDARSLSLGEGGLGLGEERVGGAVVPRNAQPLFNLHALGSLFWDQRVRRGPDSIETPADALITPEMRDVFEFGAVSAQAMFPVTSREEMRGQRFRNGPDDNELAPFAAVDEIWELLVERLVAIPEYVTLFAAAYPDTDVDDLTFAHAANAIAGFEVRAFEARQSPWNRFLEGDDTALTDLELEGAAEFIAAGCVECHRGPMLTDDQAHNTGLAQFGPGHDDGPLHNEDYGRGGETGAADRYAFRTAPLVNVALTGPWGHAGQYGELQRFVEHYADPAEELRSYVAAHEVADGERYLADMGATDADAILAGLDDAATVEIGDMEALLAFLGALTDPASRDLAWTVPDVVPSGLPVDDAPAPVIGGASEGTVGFVDLAAEPTSGLADYHRVPSARNAIAEFWQQQSLDEPMDFFGVFATPLRWRGMPGVSIFDYDLDGDEDLFVTNGPGAPNSLLQNQLLETGELTFVDRAAAAGVEATATDSSGSCYGDIDNDGDHDLFVVADAGRSHLFENDGDGTFTDISVESGSVVDGIGGTSCAFGDIDGDGLLDLFVARAWHQDDLQACFLEPFGAGIQHNELYLNAGANTFVDVSDTSGIRDLGGLPPFAQGAPTITWSVSLVDYDLDGDVDIFTADDQCGLPNSTIGGLDRGFLQVFDNDGTGTFTNRTVEAGTNEPSAWMGLSFGDFDSDGYLDFFSPSFGDWGKLVAGAPVILGDETSRWFLGGPDKTFDNPGVGDLQRMPFGWGTVARDFDNDGDTDISFQGGMDLWFMVDASNPGSVLSNDGDAHFGLDRGAFATNHTRRNDSGVAAADLDRDGFVDIVSVSNFDLPEPLPLRRFGSEDRDIYFFSVYDPTAFFSPAFELEETPAARPTNKVERRFSWNPDAVYPDGSIAVEMNQGNDNGWVSLRLVGAVDLTPAGRVNRDAIGAMVTFTPEGGRPVMAPVLGGASHLSQDSLEQGFGLGQAERGTVDILWPGGVRNRLYDVCHAEQLTLPEIGCSIRTLDDRETFVTCLDDELSALQAAGVVDATLADRLRDSALRAYDAS